MSERLRLLCFPNAGGGASAYRLWQERLPDDIEVCAVQLPGRENRLREPALRELPALIELLRAETAQLRRGPFAFFGHSLGALVAFELTRALRRAGERLPVQLFVSSCRAPHTDDEGVALSELDDASFLGALREFAGTPEAVLQDHELLALVLPTLRADFALRDGYRCAEEPGLALPITVYGGEDDAHVSLSSLFAWRAHTQRSFSLARFPGGHFYFRDQPAFYLTLGHALSRLTRRSRGVRLEERDGSRH
ncbi:MAG TPA: alpha/beta fold hydrolase [Polyangiales bacterium]|nr:alpha/beta fold hydrolase [Polyangiales bacterium]